MYEISNLEIRVPGPVKEILDTLEAGGYEAYIVGGCVRDAIIGMNPKDWDITTSALPEQVKSLFSNTADTGIQHGTVLVIRHGVGYEVTTYRIDGDYRDGRHPEKVTFTRSLAEDLKRRDFTINAFAYHPKRGVVDLFDGIRDLDEKLIRCVGDADERFSEDALRIMRAVRFSGQLGFEIETKTLAAITHHVSSLGKVSMERIRVEFEKTLLSRNPQMVNRYAELEMAPFILPDKGISEKCFDPETTALYPEVKGNPEEIRIVRLALFFRRLTEEEAKKTLRYMKYDNKTISKVTGILRQKERLISPEPVSVKHALKEMGEELFRLLLTFRETVKGEEETGIREVLEEVIAKGEPFSLSQLAVCGSDLMDAGIPKGIRVGEVLRELLEIVISDPKQNDKAALLNIIKEEGGSYGL